jgi:hypothetical protein
MRLRWIAYNEDSSLVLWTWARLLQMTTMEWMRC